MKVYLKEKKPPGFPRRVLPLGGEGFVTGRGQEDELAKLFFDPKGGYMFYFVKVHLATRL